MIESMVTATAHNIRDELAGKEPPSLSALCLADFGDTGVVFLAVPQIPPRNTTWSSQGKWCIWLKLVLKNILCVKYAKVLVSNFMKE